MINGVACRREGLFFEGLILGCVMGLFLHTFPSGNWHGKGELIAGVLT